MRTFTPQAAAGPTSVSSLATRAQCQPRSQPGSASCSSQPAPSSRRNVMQLGITSVKVPSPSSGLRSTASAAVEAPPAVQQEEASTAEQQEPQNPTSSSGAAEEGGVMAKFLVNTAWATAIIGRGGLNVRQLQQDTGTRVQLSSKDSYHPGTRSRVLLIRGERPAIEAALRAVLRRRDELPLQMVTPEETKTLNMLVPVVVCGSILGPGASNLAALQEQSGAVITLTSREKQGPFIPDRTVRITGNNEEVVAGSMAVLDLLLESTRYSSVARGLLPYRTVVLPVPNKAIGVIMGKRGESILQLQSVTGVSMSVSAPDSTPAPSSSSSPGAEGSSGGGGGSSSSADIGGNGSGSSYGYIGERTVTISGMPRSVALALQLVEQKVAQVLPRYRLPEELSYGISYYRGPNGSNRATEGLEEEMEDGQQQQAHADRRQQQRQQAGVEQERSQVKE